MRRIVHTAAALAFLLTTSSAHAGAIIIDYDLGSSVVSMLGGLISIPPDGSITSATATVVVPGSSLSNASAGPGNLQGLNLAASVNATVVSAATLTGGFTGVQVGNAAGTLTGGLGNLVLGTLNLNLTGVINCTPAGICGALGTFPILLMGTSPITGIGNVGIGGVNTPGAGTLNAVLPIMIGGAAAQINLVGQEVSRSYVPEPSSFGLLGLGILGLAGVGWRRAHPRR
jgi:hypothetical protein